MIKRCFLLFAMFAVVFTATAQSEQGSTAKDYNKFTIELSGGANAPFGPYASGYHGPVLGPWVVDGGVRYMFNPKFGLRLSGGYEQFSNAKKGSKEFSSSLWNIKLEGVSNLGRVMNFEDWTSDLGLLGHVGIGYGNLQGDGLAMVTVGVTPQIRLSNRVVIFLDATLFLNKLQSVTFDGKESLPSGDGYFSNNYYKLGANFHLLGGISVALGKHGRHADWVAGDDRVRQLEGRVANLESQVGDLDRRVTANTINDANGNRIADEVETLLENEYLKKGDVSTQTTVTAEVDAAAQLLNREYLSIYFDFGSAVPQRSSGWTTNFVVRFLRNNPSATVSIEGFADELGSAEANQKLSEKRVEAAKQVLLDAGIDASRITTVAGKGVDNSVNKSSAPARQIARRATFKLN